MLAAWKSIGSSVAVRVFEASVDYTFLVACLSAVLLGILGVAASCRMDRCLCCHLWLTLLLSFACITGGLLLMLQVDSDAIRIERFCEKVRSSAGAAEYRLEAANEARGVADGAASAERGAPELAAAQRAYDSLLQALLACRQKWPEALALSEEDCRGAEDSNHTPWEAVHLQELFVSAESEHSCSGFCRDGPSIFALPEGEVDEANRAEVREACFKPLVEEIRTLSSTASLLLLALGEMLLAPVCCSCWLLCAPPPVSRDDYVHRPGEAQWLRLPQDVDDADGGDGPSQRDDE